MGEGDSVDPCGTPQLCISFFHLPRRHISGGISESSFSINKKDITRRMKPLRWSVVSDLLSTRRMVTILLFRLFPDPSTLSVYSWLSILLRCIGSSKSETPQWSVVPLGSPARPLAAGRNLHLNLMELSIINSHGKKKRKRVGWKEL